MSAENKAMFQQFVDGMNAKDSTFIDRLVDPNLVDHDPMPGQSEGLEGIKEQIEVLFAGFPDLKVTVNKLISEGDVVSGAVKTEGTHTGEFMGIPATNKKMSMTEIHMIRPENGKMIEHWGLADAMTMMQQLGVLPEM